MKTSKEQKWLPVFTVIESKKKRFASYSGQESLMGQKEERDIEDYELRIGTAIDQNDGSYKINLVAFPVNGTLIMRPPNRDEHQDITKGVKS
jgi:hypothetical protein